MTQPFTPDELAIIAELEAIYRTPSDDLRLPSPERHPGLAQHPVRWARLDCIYSDTVYGAFLDLTADWDDIAQSERWDELKAEAQRRAKKA